MGNSVYVTGTSASPPVTTAQAESLHAALQPYLNGLHWPVEPFSTDPDWAVTDYDWWVATKIGFDSVELQLAQVIALTRVASKVFPEWVFEIADDLAALEGEDGAPMALQNGEFTHGGPAGEMFLFEHLEFDDDGRFKPDGDLADSSESDSSDSLLAELDELTALLDGLDDDDDDDVESSTDAPERAEHTPLSLAETFDVQPHATQPQLAEYSLRSEAPDDDGDVRIRLRATVFNALTVSDSVSVDVNLCDADGSLIASLSASEEGPFQEGENVLVSDSEWLRNRGLPADVTVAIRVSRTELTAFEVGPVLPGFSGADDDGDVRWSLSFEVQNNGPAWDSGEVILHWLDADGQRSGEQESEDVSSVPQGLSVVSVYSYLREHPRRKRGSLKQVGCRAFVAFNAKRTRTFQVTESRLPRLTIGEPASASPPESSQHEASPPAAPAATRAAEPSGGELDVDAALSGDAPDVVMGLQHITTTVQKRYATRVRGLLKHTEPTVRAHAATCLGAIGGASLVIPLRALLNDADADVREAAKSVIAGLQS